MSEDVLIDGYTFLASGADGQLSAVGGLYHRDTRHLSSLDVAIADGDLEVLDRERPDPGCRRLRYADLASTVNEMADSADQKHTALVMDREQVVREGVGLREQWRVRNHARTPWTGELSVSFDADFADLFEIRGIAGDLSRQVESSRDDTAVTYRYTYPTDDGDRALSTTVAFGEEFDRVEPGRASASLDLGPGEDATLYFAVGPGVSTVSEFPLGSDPRQPETVSGVADALSAAGSPDADTYARCGRDLTALVTETDLGVVPLAGVPWFATQFGRDMLVTAYQTLPVWPALARGTLRFLADRQGTTADETTGEQPGKVFHEIRHGELARRGLVGHTPSYASIDATPLWVVLLHETHHWLGDEELLGDLWPNAKSALDWLTRTADADPASDDPFIYYDRPDAEGLEHGGWKDTTFGVQFADGDPADPPLASVEVQGYAYDAYRRGAELARELGDPEAAKTYERRADTLRDAFEDAFWMPDESFYAAALTADGRQADTVTSNVGHCLWSDVIPTDRASEVADRLLADDLFTGWGIRTLSADAGGYSPVSYHSGSVWPHDNALVALGLTRYGFRERAERVARGILDAGRRFEGSLPELFCGFDDRPVRYPASCEPQAWSAGTPFALLRAVFALDPAPDRDGVQVASIPDTIPAEAVRPLFEHWTGTI